MLCTVQHLALPAANHAAAEPVPLAGMLVGQEYYARKRQLILDEQLLLRSLRFDLTGTADQPHKWVYAFCVSLRVSRSALRLATCLVNDSLLRAGLRHPPAVTAAAALEIALQLLQEQVGAREEAPWPELVGLQPAAVAQARDVLSAMMLVDFEAGAAQDTAAAAAGAPLS